jgi:acyl-CoA thioester hydrolase
MVGHVNNATYATFMESGRVSFLYAPERPLKPPGHDFVIVRLVIDFRAEAHYPGDVRIGTRLLALGSRSFTLGQGVFKDGACIATGESVLVLIDHDNRRAVPLPETLRERLQAL